MEEQVILSIVTPAYNEAENLARLHELLHEVMSKMEIDWEWLIVDDHSDDNTFQVMKTLSAENANIRAIRLARNSGSHAAIMCGLDRASGECASVLVADLQDPPEVILKLFEKWQQGTKVVWAVRSQREGEGRSKVILARLYYWLMSNYVGIKNVPPSGSDFFLIDRQVIRALQEHDNNNSSILVMLMWLGFEQGYVTYDKKARYKGSSSWSMERRIKLAIDSITAFTYKPIRTMTYVGFIMAMIGFLYAIVVIINAVNLNSIPGWSSLMVVLLIVGGIQIVMMGILGEYLWRALDEARQRPRYIVEHDTEQKKS